MRFLVKNDGKKSAVHVWTEGDTLCRMASTGGLDLKRYVTVTELDQADICHMCEVVFAGLSQKSQQNIWDEGTDSDTLPA
jgi:hypothetical protein